MSLNVAIDELPLVQAFALSCYNTEHSAWCPVERVSDGYVAQDVANRTRKARR